MEIPKIFWAYYDLFRRKEIDISQFSKKTSLSETEISRILKEIAKNI